MYEHFYHFRERPFALSPDPEYLYPSRVHRLALDYLRYGIAGATGFIVITGEIGSGKTTLLQTFLRNLDGEMAVARIVNAGLEPRELLQAILFDLGVETPPGSKAAMLRELSRILVQQRASGRRVLLAIDEAQNLSLPSLEEVRMLSNLETEKSKLIQIVLVGQPELRDTFALPQLEQLRQRITVAYHIHPFDADETEAYINYRLRRAALGAPLEFPRVVTDLIYQHSRGVPRMINVICDAALLCGYSEERRIIDPPLLNMVFDDLAASGLSPVTHSAPTSLPVLPSVSPPLHRSAGDLPTSRTVETRSVLSLPAQSLESLAINLPRIAPSSPTLEAVRMRNEIEPQESHQTTVPFSGPVDEPTKTSRQKMPWRMGYGPATLSGLTLLLVLSFIGIRMATQNAQMNHGETAAAVTSGASRSGEIRTAVASTNARTGTTGPEALALDSRSSDSRNTPSLPTAAQSSGKTLASIAAVPPARPRAASGQKRPINSTASSARPTSGRPVFIGTLLISSIPSGGTVFIDGNKVGSTPIRVRKLRAGEHAVWIERDGHQRWTASVLVAADKQTQLAVSLRRAASGTVVPPRSLPSE